MKQRFRLLKYIRIIFSFCSFCAFVCAGAFAQNSTAAAAPYHDAKLPVEQRVADLLPRMTLEEKVAQSEVAWQNRQSFKDPQGFFVDENGAFNPGRAAMILKNGMGET